MSNIKKAMITSNNVITNIILVRDDDDPSKYGAEWLPIEPSNIAVGWLIQNGQW